MSESTSDPPVEARLAAMPPFSFLAEEAALALLSKCRTVKATPGQQLVREGRYPAELLVSLDGRLKRVKNGENGESRADGAGEMIAAYEPLGLDCLMSGTPYPYSLFADQETTIRIVPWKDLKPLIAQISGLETYLRLISESAVAREMDMSLDEMGCSPAFRVKLLSALRPQGVTPETWLAKKGEAPEFIFYGTLGTVQAYSDAGGGVLKALWIAPNFTWQLFESCLAQTPLTHSLKAVSKLEVYKIYRHTLAALKETHPQDFEAFARLALRVETDQAEDEKEEDIENLEELFPTPPRPTKTLRFSYPHVQQNDEMDCGPACMSMISKYYGNDLPIQFWRARMSTNREGTSLFDLAKAAEKVGFVCHGVGVEDLQGLESSLFPLIALRKYHYLVVYRAGWRGPLVGDPAIGVRQMTWADFKTGFDGNVLLLKPTENFYHETAPLRGYWHYIDMFKGQNFELGMVLLTSLMLTVLQLVPAFLSQFIIDEVLANKDVQLLRLVLLATIAAAAMIGVMSWLRSYYISFVSSRFDFASVSAFMRKLFSLPYDFFATRHVGDFTRRLSELDRIRMFVTGSCIETLLHFLNLGVYGFVLFKYSPQVAGVVYCSAPLLLLLSVLFSRRMQKQYGEVFTNRADQEGLIADQIKGMATIKTLGAEVSSRWRFEEALVRTLKATYNFQLTGATLSSLSYFANQAISFAVVGEAAYMAIRGQMTPGQVVSISIISAGIIEPFSALAAMWSEIMEMRTVMDRLNDVFLAESEARADKRALIKQRLRGEIEFRDVWFRYGGDASDWVLKGMTFRILPGQSVAIVGGSGAGKSTLAMLTARLYEPTKGTILIDGRDYREYDRQWLRKQIGLLLQETSLFHGTILENIAYGDPRPDMARVEAVAEMADAKNFVHEKSSGYDYIITHGGLGLSGGQKQRISIARILYDDPTILFMDEATSSLDANSERVIAKSLREASKDRTVISIAHRYNTVKMSDFAMVVDGGRVVEFGTHAELLAMGGHYAKLFGDQIGG